MNHTAPKKQQSRIISILLIIILTVSLILLSALYVNDYYRADTESIVEFIGHNADVDIQKSADGITAFVPENIEAGFIFYPGGKVKHTAYYPLMNELASHGILSIICEMPFNLAVLDQNKADGITASFPEVKSWYVGGHSLGGSMAASYLSNNIEDFCGLILLASYSTADLSDTKSEVLSIYGSFDGVMNREKYEKYKSNLPSDFTEMIIEGGNHAYFGMYGEQEGDGISSLTPAEQTVITADKIAEFILK